jgi:site-specific DNA-methyltransferase (adenine-specific)
MIELYNTDSIAYMKTLPSESIDLIATDPPYPVTARGSSGNAGGMLQSELNKKGLVFENNNVNISDYAPQFYRILKDGSHCYVMTNHINLIEMLNTFTDCGFHFIKSLIWDKGNKIMGQYYMSQFEYILFFRKGFGKQINNCGTSDILSIPNNKNKDIVDGSNLHDTEKPVELMKILVSNSTQEGELVLDPFMGVGSTGIACKELNRDFIGCEIDKHYFDIAQSRISSVKDFNISKLKEVGKMSLLNRINKS